MMTLKSVSPGQRVRVKKVVGEPQIRLRIVEMGITPGTEIFVEKVASLGDPIEVKVRGYNLSLRKHEAEMIEVEPLTT